MTDRVAPRERAAPDPSAEVSAPPTLAAVASLAGVSRSTASRVINDSPHVTPAAVASVNRAIGVLGYIPNGAARTLASKRTAVVALVFPESAARVFADPFFASLTQGVARHLADTDYTLSLLLASEGRPAKTRRFLTGGNADGALVVSHHSGDHSYADVKGLPIVFGGRPLGRPGATTYFVDSDNVAGARLAVRHLLERGRAGIAVVAGPEDMPPGRDRLAGAVAAAEEAGTALVAVERGDFTPAAGAEAARRLLRSGVAFDGLFAANDQMAAGAVEVLQAAGRSVPGDVAVVGFDDDHFARSSTPPLTSVRQDPQLLGSTMAAVLVDLVAGRPVPHASILPTELVVRESSGADR